MDLRVGRLPKIRVLPQPEDSLRTLVERAPQAEAWADRMMERFRPTLTLLYNMRRRLATTAVAVAATSAAAVALVRNRGEHSLAPRAA